MHTIKKITNVEINNNITSIKTNSNIETNNSNNKNNCTNINEVSLTDKNKFNNTSKFNSIPKTNFTSSTQSPSNHTLAFLGSDLALNPKRKYESESRFKLKNTKSNQTSFQELSNTTPINLLPSIIF